MFQSVYENMLGETFELYYKHKIQYLGSEELKYIIMLMLMWVFIHSNSDIDFSDFYKEYFEPK